MDDVAAWAKAFAFTLIVEVPIVVWLLRRDDRRVARRVTFAIYANLATHPIVWFVFPRWIAARTASVAASEVFAVVVETIAMAVALRVSGRRAAWVAAVIAIANGASLGVGLAVRAATGWI
jgi:hypothetical protein